jgi:hypothetical protein
MGSDPHWKRSHHARFGRVALDSACAFIAIKAGTFDLFASASRKK